MKFQNNRFSVSDIALIGMMTALLEAVKRALEFLPNVELVSFFIILFTLYYGKRAVFAVYGFVLLECFVWGFGLWTVSYFYVWTILWACTLRIGRGRTALTYSILSGAFGLLFGALCTFPVIAVSGPAAAAAWWISGIPFDILHCVSNFVLCFVLYGPVSAAIEKIRRT